ncbi:MAG: DnaB-like helicase N-terminal domain-containing protein [Intestinibacter bartlettii]|nr:DnaB-like helicase N-terminal domain-containing protein [Intestinibacter bartlettii]
MALYNFYAEQSVLGSILIEPESILVANQFNLGIDDFYHPQHQILFNCMKKIQKQGEAIDFITLKHNLEKEDLLEKAGGVSYFTSLTSAVPTTSNIDYHIKILKELSTKRNIYNLISDKAKTIKKMDGQDMIKLAEEVKATVLDSPCVDDLFVDASDITLDTKPSPSIETGFAPLDAATSGGLNFGTLTVLTGSPGSGKSTFLNQILANALSLGFNSFLYSGELTSQMALDWFYKTVSNPIHLSYGVNNFGKTIKVTDEGVRQINKWLKNKLFLFSKNAQADETNISTVIEYLAVKKDVKLFVLDNLMTIECSGSDKYEKQINVIKSLKNLAKHYNIVIILVAHSNKNSIMRREPHVFDISGASEIANLSDYILNATRDNDCENETTILLLKNRITGLIKKHLQLKFSQDRKRFYTNAKLELSRDYGYGEVYEQESFC